MLFHFLDLPVPVKDNVLAAFKVAPQLIHKPVGFFLVPGHKLTLLDLNEVEFVFVFDLLFQSLDFLFGLGPVPL